MAASHPWLGDDEEGSHGASNGSGSHGWDPNDRRWAESRYATGEWAYGDHTDSWHTGTGWIPSPRRAAEDTGKLLPESRQDPEGSGYLTDPRYRSHHPEQARQIEPTRQIEPARQPEQWTGAPAYDSGEWAELPPVAPLSRRTASESASYSRSYPGTFSAGYPEENGRHEREPDAWKDETRVRGAIRGTDWVEDTGQQGTARDRGSPGKDSDRYRGTDNYWDRDSSDPDSRHRNGWDRDTSRDSSWDRDGWSREGWDRGGWDRDDRHGRWVHDTGQHEVRDGRPRPDPLDAVDLADFRRPAPDPPPEPWLEPGLEPRPKARPQLRPEGRLEPRPEPLDRPGREIQRIEPGRGQVDRRASTGGFDRRDLAGDIERRGRPRAETGFQPAVPRRRAQPLPPATVRARARRRLRPVEDDFDEDTGYGYAGAVAMSAVWYLVPVALYALWALTLGGSPEPNCQDPSGNPCGDPRTEALTAFVSNVPRLATAVCLSLVVALIFRWSNPTWRAATIGFGSAVVGAGVATIVFAVLGTTPA